MIQPLHQLAELEKSGRLLLRLEDGELAEPDGQFHFDFSEEPTLSSMRIMPGPRTAGQWFEQAIEQEQASFFDEAVDPIASPCCWAARTLKSASASPTPCVPRASACKPSNGICRPWRLTRTMPSPGTTSAPR